MNPGLPLHTRVRIRLKHRTKPKPHLLEHSLTELEKAGLYSWHYYLKRKRRAWDEVWFPAHEAQDR